MQNLKNFFFKYFSNYKKLFYSHHYKIMSHCSATYPNVVVWEGKISNLAPSYTPLNRTYMGKGNPSTTSALPPATTASSNKELRTQVRPSFGGAGLGPSNSLISNIPVPATQAQTPGFTSVMAAYGNSGYCGNRF
jgi:hypothetical protein